MFQVSKSTEFMFKELVQIYQDLIKLEAKIGLMD